MLFSVTKFCCQKLMIHTQIYYVSCHDLRASVFEWLMTPNPMCVAQFATVLYYLFIPLLLHLCTSQASFEFMEIIGRCRQPDYTHDSTLFRYPLCTIFSYLLVLFKHHLSLWKYSQTIPAQTLWKRVDQNLVQMYHRICITNKTSRILLTISSKFTMMAFSVSS